ncbi:MAG: replicative DNA helicase [Bacteroidales bacterium]|nr:replicative DNA helicase [Candidatus Colicola equi]
MGKQIQKPTEPAYIHKPLHDPALEKLVLGEIILSESAVMAQSIGIVAESFYDEQNSKIYQAIDALVDKGRPLDLATVAFEAMKSGVEAWYVNECALEATSTAPNHSIHCMLLQQLYISRRTLQMGEELAAKSADRANDVADILAWIQESTDRITQGLSAGVDAYETVVERTVQSITEAEKRMAENPDGIAGISTGLREYDNATGGLKGDELTILAARPSMGKTTVALQMAYNIAAQKRPVAVFSLEMGQESLCKRLISLSELTPLKPLVNGGLDGDAWRKVDRHVVRSKNLPIYLLDTPGISITDICARTKMMVERFGVQAIFVDYIGLVSNPSLTARSREQEVAQISRRLKQLSRELHIPVVCLAQVNRKVEDRGGDKRPWLSDLRESGSIEQDADNVTFLHRPEKYGITEFSDGTSTAGSMLLIIAKNRNGECKDVNVHVLPEYTSVVNW